jgi:prevent-host-death family protein
MARRNHTWGVARAKAQFSEMIDRALSEGPQTVTRRGRTEVVVVSADEWERKTKRKGNLAEFFANSPLRGSGIRVARDKSKAREIEI